MPQGLTLLPIIRLRWSLRHAFENFALYRKRFAEAGVHPDDLESLMTWRNFPSRAKAIYATTIQEQRLVPRRAQPQSQLIGRQLPAQTLDVRLCLCRCKCSASACLIGCGCSA